LALSPEKGPFEGPSSGFLGRPGGLQVMDGQGEIPKLEAVAFVGFFMGWEIVWVANGTKYCAVALGQDLSGLGLVWMRHCVAMISSLFLCDVARSLWQW